ncbi:MAG: AAA domain-containing protein [Verrucomicrobiota bacterium]
MTQETDTQQVRERFTKLFEFLKAYTDLRYPPVRDIDQQLRTLWLKDLPAHPSVELFKDPGHGVHEGDDSDVVLRLTRPTITRCPAPPAPLVEWLNPGWQELGGRVEVEKTRTNGKGPKAQVERFEDDYRRPSLLRSWQQQREQWVASERPARKAQELFQAIYEWHGVQDREGEKIEMLVGDGFVRCPAEGGEFQHPVLLQRLELEFYPEKRQPQFVFRKREQPPELYMEFLRTLPGVNNAQLARCADELRKAEFAPLGGEDTGEFLRRLIQGLFPEGGRVVETTRSPSALGIPLGIPVAPGVEWEASPSSNVATVVAEEGPTIERRPVIFMRQRRTGPSNIFDLVLEDIANREVFPPSLMQILGLAKGTTKAPVTEVSELSFGNEDESVLLSKPANREQLEIAKQLARRDCVLVQGPPGTGKTHTIANMIGHLLAHGKRVLVTAHTPKALRVLRQQVVEALQPLCISVLHNDKQSQEELQSAVRRIHVRLAEDDRRLEWEAQQLREERGRILKALCDARQGLLNARQDETRDVVFGGTAIRPIHAAKRVKEGVGRNDWIPAPVKPGETMPLSHAEVVELYQTNARITQADERELNSRRPDLGELPAPGEFQAVVAELNSLANQNLRLREELWDGSYEPAEPAEFDRMLETASKTIEFLRNSAPWQLEAVQAGLDGQPARRVWDTFVEMIETTWREVNECYTLVVEHGPSIDDGRPAHELLPIAEDIIRHIEAGKPFDMLTRLTKRQWLDFIERTRLGTRLPDLKSPTDMKAVRALLRMRLLRDELVERWERLMAAQGAPPASELSDKPEQVCKQFVTQIRACLEWHTTTWQPLEREFHRLGFRWPAYLESTPPETGSHAALRRIRRAVLGELAAILESRSAWLRHKRLQAQLAAWRELLPDSDEPQALAMQHLRQAMRDVSPADFQAAHEELARLKSLEPDLARRRELLALLARSAPAWASAVENRLPRHARPQPSGEPEAAWEWRQLHDELERRASVSLDQLQNQIEELSQRLREVTAQLVEKQTWMNQIRQTAPAQKQALGAYALMRKQLTQTGKGIRDAELRAAARREMATAKDAVPVWIMPLAEVVETFDPRKTRFDVVIIDEASQCDPSAIFALYLGQQTIIVGDDEQVTPVAVGVDMDQVSKLIRERLDGVPHKELYHGETSIYELSQIAFGGVIRLVEHFRCAPDIIAFSNNLSYRGEIKPLREASSIALSPHVVHYRVQGGRDVGDNVNEAEAETIASLICAAIEQPEYTENESGEPMTFGVVTLVGDKQALRVDSILRQRLEPAEYRRRQILCGDSAQFQGDERDVMFLSLVDSVTGKPPLPMRQEGPKKIFKKRFNVAASRARDQMWVVHSLDHEVELQSGDFRRLLVEHSLDPSVWEREMHKHAGRAESAFEERVLEKLLEARYNVRPQFPAGAYRIDMVVAGGGRRLAIECDGEQYQSLEKIREDMERQAILERLGWKFVRVRGSLFFRDEDRALEPVFTRLRELNIAPDLDAATPAPAGAAAKVVEAVTRRAQELRLSWHAEKD